MVGKAPCSPTPPEPAQPLPSWLPKGVVLYIRCHQRSHVFILSAAVEFLVHFLAQVNFICKKKKTLTVSKFELKPDDTPFKQKPKFRWGLDFLNALQCCVFNWSLCFSVNLNPNSPAPSPHLGFSTLSTQLLRSTKKKKKTVTSILYTSLIITSEGPDAKVLFHFVWMWCEGTDIMYAREMPISPTETRD